MIVKLEVSDNRSKVKRVTLQSDAVIGRSADCNLRIASSQVSRHHCKISISDTQVRVKDLGSSNGTFLNGDLLPANKEVSISSGAQIAVGPVRFVARFELPANAEDAPGSTVEIPAVPEGKTAAEVLAPQAAEPAGQVASGALARAIAAAAKAEQQAPQQVEELVSLVRSGQRDAGDAELPVTAKETPADAPAAEQSPSDDAADQPADQISEPVAQKDRDEGKGTAKIVLPEPPTTHRVSSPDDTVDWNENEVVDSTPSNVRAPAGAEGHDVISIDVSDEEAVEEDVDEDSDPDETVQIHLEEPPAVAGDFQFVQATPGEPPPIIELGDDEAETAEYLADLDDEQPGDDGGDAEESDAPAEPAARKGRGLGSLFGLLGGKEQVPAEVDDGDEAADEGEAELEAADDAQDVDEQPQFDASAEEDDEVEAVADDDVALFLYPEQAEEAAEGVDESLGDFLKQLGDD